MAFHYTNEHNTIKRPLGIRLLQCKYSLGWKNELKKNPILFSLCCAANMNCTCFKRKREAEWRKCLSSIELDKSWACSGLQCDDVGWVFIYHSSIDRRLFKAYGQFVIFYLSTAYAQQISERYLKWGGLFKTVYLSAF